MAKRIASSDINHDNWDAPYESEEAGSFKVAPQETLQKRVIKSAKRRIKTSDSSDVGKSSVFASFGGFKPVAPSLSSSTNKPFSFLSGGPTTSSTVTPPTNGTEAAKDRKITPEEKYLSDLKELNLSVTDWIKTHVDSNPVCILSPVFSDYEKYLKRIQADRDATNKSDSPMVSSTPASLSSFNFVSSSTSDNKFTKTMPTTSLVSEKSTLTFTDSKVSASSPDSKPSPQTVGLKKEFTINMPTTSMDSEKLKFSFTDSKLTDSKQSPPESVLKSQSGKSPLLQGAGTGTSQAPSLFSLFEGSSTGSSLLAKPNAATLMENPFTATTNKPEAKPNPFNNGSITTSSSNNQQQDKEKEEEEESDEPPKVEFTPVQEEGSVFSTRCKVFVKKDSNYKDRGVGTLFIKKVGEEKHQLLVRAETVLGNVLLNVLLSSSIPTKRMGKNNVMLVCMPTPQDLPPPTTVLLRVKTDAEADELLATIDQYKP